MHAEGDLDFRGTLAVEQGRAGRLRRDPALFDLDTDATAEQVETLMSLTERYCVVYQTLAKPAELSASAAVSTA